MTFRLLVLSACLLPAAAQAQAPEGHIVFKDGYIIHGRVLQQKQFEIDPASGIAISIPSPTGFTYIDDFVRRIYFPPGQIDRIVKDKLGDATKDQIAFTRPTFSHSKPLLLPAWKFKDSPLPAFNKNWERDLVVLNPTAQFTLNQRIVLLTPERMQIQARFHNWEINYLTKELALNADGLESIRRLITDYLESKKDANAAKKEKDAPKKDKDATKDPKVTAKKEAVPSKYSPDDISFVVAKFYQQMGRIEEAERLAKELLVKAPEHKKKLDDFLDALNRDKAKKFGAEFEPLAAAKQHRTILDKIAVYDKEQLADKVPEKTKLLVQDLKNKYQADTEKLDKVKGLFKFLMGQGPDPRGFWLNATTTILAELNYDTVPRLDTFITFAEQHQRDVAAKDKTPSLKVENVLALAITGWHLGNVAAEPDIKLAQNLWKGRQFVKDYMRADTAGQRSVLSDKWAKETGLPIDVVARMMQHLPPPNAYGKLSKDMMTLNLDLPDAPTGSYLVQLPPEYHHQRPHPVLMLMHGREPPEILLQRWAPLAARSGFILMAPLGTKFSTEWYSFSAREHTYVMNCLKDLKRRFQVDTDRVFLFGWAAGGDVAWDIGLAHPDQFAGVLPMCGVPKVFARRYWQNAQNLGLYVVDGDKNGDGPVLTRGLMKEWIRFNYNAYYLEYKGRANELYLGEFEPMMDWMSRKKRKYPTDGLGSYSTSGATAEEFRSHRQSDNRFYWLSSDEISDKNIQDYSTWVTTRSPALFQAKIGVSNPAPNAKGDARIETIISLRHQGLKQCTIWLAPSMIDFTKPIQVRINNKSAGGLRNVTPSITTMLEEYFSNVDRQRLFFAKIDLKL
jgi:pimeloyl-ACP methyl ester carboxylesterase